MLLLAAGVAPAGETAVRDAMAEHIFADVFIQQTITLNQIPTSKAITTYRHMDGLKEKWC